MADVAEQKVAPGGVAVGAGVAEVNLIALIGNIWWRLVFLALFLLQFAA